MNILVDANAYLAVLLNEPEKQQIIGITKGTELVSQEVIIKEKNGRRFKITPIEPIINKSPFEEQGIDTGISTSEMINFLKESRSGLLKKQ